MKVISFEEMGGGGLLKSIGDRTDKIQGGLN